MRQYIRRFLLWLLRVICKEEPIVIPTSVLDAELMRLTKILCDRQDLQSAPGTSGEYKRDRVFEQLLNTFPKIRPKYLHLAILLTRLL